MSRSHLLTKWSSEFCAPVVATIVTAEVESVCLKNGMLFHELLSAFGHIDGINTQMRSVNQSVILSDAHIRFERVTELRAKSSGSIEELLRSSFEEVELARVPATTAELKAAIPTAWSPRLEQLLIRSMSFSEYEMISHPVILLTVVSTSDPDPVACMQELASYHHTPPCLSTGQYDPDVHRVYLLLHDPFSAPGIDPNSVLRRLQARFPPSQTKLLVLNSLSPSTPNLQQPDMWSRSMFPMFFPQHAPALDPAQAIPMNPLNGVRVLGSRLSMEDFMAIRDFCVSLFQHDIVPFLERRIAVLNKIVAENRKGVRNFVKGMFFRKKEEVPPAGKAGAGAPRYRYDRIEAQMLLLADTCFIIKDYEGALGIYNLVRNDFRSDKSMVHLAHTVLMIAACTLLGEPGRSKDMAAKLESVNQVLATITEPMHATGYFAMLAGEMLSSTSASSSSRNNLDAASYLLQAANSVNKLTLLSGLLLEKSASYYLQASQPKKFCLHEVLAGLKIHGCGRRPARHALVCFACAMLFHDKGKWGGIKTKLARAMADDLKTYGAESAQRGLILLLRVLDAVINESSNVCGQESMKDAVVVLKELLEPGPFGVTSVDESWSKISARQVLQGTLPVSNQLVTPLHLLPGYDVSTGAVPPERSYVEVCGLAIPELDKRTLFLMQPVNGYVSMVPYSPMGTAPEVAAAEELKMQLDCEKKWGLGVEAETVAAQAAASAEATASRRPQSSMSVSVVQQGEENLETFVQMLVEAEEELRSRTAPGARSFKPSPDKLQVPLGERLVIRGHLKNRLPLDLALSGLRLEMNPAEAFDVQDVNITLPNGGAVVVHLAALPFRQGSYTADFARWNLSDVLTVRTPLHKEGPLLQKSLHQRATNARGEDVSMQFDVISAYALLQISFEGLSEEVLQGQLMKATFVIRNEGAAPACDIDLKLSQPCFVFYIEDDTAASENAFSALNVDTDTESDADIIPLWGQSCSVVRLPPGTIVPPGEQLRLSAWLRLVDLGKQRVSILASYKAMMPDGTVALFGSTQSPRTSYVSIQTKIINSVSIAARVTSRPSSNVKRVLSLDITNKLPPSSSSSSSSSAAAAAHIDITSRNSSIGQLDFDISAFADENAFLEEGSFKVEGVLVIGGARPSTDSKAAMQTNRYKDLVLANDEYAAMCLPIDFVTPTSSTEAPTTASMLSSTSSSSSSWSHRSDATLLKTAWALPLSSASAKSFSAPSTPTPIKRKSPTVPVPATTTATAINSTTDSMGAEDFFANGAPPLPPGPSTPSVAPAAASLAPTSIPPTSLAPAPAPAPLLSRVLERFMCMGAANKRLQRELLEARVIYQQELLEADNMGPRSIAQVRKGRQKGDEEAAEAEALSTAALSDVADSLSTISLDDNVNKTSPRDPASSGAATSVSCVGIPMNLAHLATAERARSTCSVAVVWSCRWHGKVRTGVHFLAGVPMIVQQLPAASPTVPRPLLIAPTRTVASWADALQVSLLHDHCVTLSAGCSGVMVPVVLELRSVCSQGLVVSVEALDRRSAGSSAGSSSRGAPKGLRWEAKTKYMGVTVDSFVTTRLAFKAMISRTGVFDLKRFKVTVGSVVSSGSDAVLKQLSGQSLLEVRLL